MTDAADPTTLQAASATVTVDDLYHALLGRSVDADGAAFFAAQVQAGTSMQDVASQIIASAEYQQSHAVQAADQFAASLYQNYLHVAGDLPGLAYWTSTVAGEGSAQATIDFINGAHALAAFVPALIGQLPTGVAGL